MSLSVHILHSPIENALPHLQTLLDRSVKLTLGAPIPTPADYHILVAGRPEREHLIASPNLRALIIPWAGLPLTTAELMKGCPHIAVHNLHHNALPVAEMVISLMLAAAKRIVPLDRSMRVHDWTPRYERDATLMLGEKTALVMGYGAIGQHVARLCRGFGMKVLAIRRQVAASPPDSLDEVHPLEDLPRLLPKTDVLIICLPHTPVTDGIIGEAELALLPPGAVLVNIARGPIVNEAALYRALRDGSLHSAGLDVWYHYPSDEAARAHTAPSKYPFHELDNVVMSPHRAGGSDDSSVRRMAHLAKLLNAAARGEEMPNQVDLDAGY